MSAVPRSISHRRGCRHPSRWSLTRPTDCIATYAVVGPMKRKPQRLSSLASAFDSAVLASMSPGTRGAGRVARSGSNDQTSAASEPKRSCATSVRRGRWRYWPRSCRGGARSKRRGAGARCRHCRSRPPVPGRSRGRARRNPSRFRRMVSHDSPDWKPSRQSFS